MSKQIERAVERNIRDAEVDIIGERQWRGEGEGRGQQVGVEAEGKSGGVKMDLWCVSILCVFC